MVTTGYIGCLRCSLCRSFINQLVDQPIRGAKSWVKRANKQLLREQTVFQYASKQAKRADRVYVWGYAATGALGKRPFCDPTVRGPSTRKQQHIPTRLDFIEMNGIKAKKVACGYGYTVIVGTKDKMNVVYGTGINTDAQIGYHMNTVKKGGSLDYVVEPSIVKLPLLYPDTTKVRHVACGRAHTVIAMENEGVITLGHNSYGQCGRPIVDGEEYRGSQIINRVPFDHSIAQVECGQDHTLLLTDAGEVYSCGLGSDGQTGLGHYGISAKLTQVKGDLLGEKIVHISSRVDCVLAVSDKGDVFGWGNNEYNQLAVAEPEHTQVNTPRYLNFRDIGKVISTAAAGSTCALLTDVGDVYVWGFGVLGKGPLAEESTLPTKVPPILFGRNEFSRDSKVEQLACGINNFAAVTNKGELYMWGNNKTGHLGFGHTKTQFFPYKVLVPAEVQFIACGVDHTVALTKGFV